MSKDKQNLIWQIDLLETKLEKDPRLYRTQYALMKQKDGGKVDKAEMEQQVAKLYQKLVDRKIHHGTNSIQKALKQAIKVEALKLQKRIKKEDKDQLKRELEVAQEMKAGDLAPVITLRQLKKSFLGTKNFRENPPAWLSHKLVQQCLDLKNEFGTHQNNVIARLTKAAGVQKACSDLIKSINHAVRNEAQQEPQPQPQPQTEKQSKSGNKSKAVAPETAASFPPQLQEDSDSSDSETPQTQTQTQSQSQKASKKQVEDVSESEEEEEGDPFLTNVPTGYISGGSDDESDIDNDKQVKEVTKQRKNRRGQRARRAIWEQKYGTGANHVIKQTAQDQARERQKEAKQKRQEQAIREKEEKKQRFDEKPLHPSWQAKKKADAITNFKGKKVTFD